MSAPSQESKTAALFYRDVPDRPADKTYTCWLEVARADCADALKVFSRTKPSSPSTGGDASPDADLPTLIGLLRDQARDNDTIAREIIARDIIADPTSANSRQWMKNALATVAGRRV